MSCLFIPGFFKQKSKSEPWYSTLVLNPYWYSKISHFWLMGAYSKLSPQSFQHNFNGLIQLMLWKTITGSSWIFPIFSSRLSIFQGALFLWEKNSNGHNLRVLGVLTATGISLFLGSFRTELGFCMLLLFPENTSWIPSDITNSNLYNFFDFIFPYFLKLKIQVPNINVNTICYIHTQI